MPPHTLTSRQVIPLPLSSVFALFAEPRNLARLTPPWLGFRLIDPPNPVMRAGLRLSYRIRPLGFPQTWVSGITVYDPPHQFVDEQRRGPYALWHHEHAFRTVGEGTEVVDTVTYALPFGVLGDLAHALVVRRQLESIFAFRANAIRELFPNSCVPATASVAADSTARS